MKDLFERVNFDKTTRLGFATAFVITFITLAFIFFSYNSLPPFIPVFNQLPWGEQRLGAKPTVFLPLMVSFLIFACNLVLSILVYKKIPLISRILAISSLTSSILVFFLIIRTVHLIL